MKINHNIAALNTYRSVSINTNNASKSLEKLSSGLRINRAGDDAAGLAISEKMRGQIRGLNMASKNSQDAISLIQTTEGALNETQSILQRMRELAVQAASDTNVTSDRQEIQKEINQLTSEINRIANTTEFNTMKVLNGDRADTIKAIKATAQNYAAATKGVYVQTGALELTTTGLSFLATLYMPWSSFDSATVTIQKNLSGQLEVMITGFATGAASGVSGFNIDDKVDISFTTSTYRYLNHGLDFSFTLDAWEDAEAGKTIRVDCAEYKGVAGNTTATSVLGSSLAIGSKITFTGLSGAVITNFAVGNNIELDVAYMSATISCSGFTATVNLRDLQGNLLFSDHYTFTAAQSVFTYSSHGVYFAVTSMPANSAIGAGANTGVITVNFDAGYSDKYVNNAMTFQVGSNQSQSIGLSVSQVDARALGISTEIFDTNGFTTTTVVTDGTNSTNVEYALNVQTQTDAASAITTIDNALLTVSSERAKLGAVQNRLEHTISNLDTSAENLTASESRIRDVDMAKEMVEYTKNSILLQAAQAMLSQANALPEGVLQLLR